MKMGISIKINTSQIDKARLFQGQKGKYLDLTLFLDPDNPSQYGDHGPITQSVTKEERAQGVKLPIIGNAKIFWADNTQGGYQPNQGQAPNSQYNPQNQQSPNNGGGSGAGPSGGYQPPQNQRPSQGEGYQGGYVPPAQGSSPAPPGPVGDDQIPF